MTVALIAAGTVAGLRLLAGSWRAALVVPVALALAVGVGYLAATVWLYSHPEVTASGAPTVTARGGIVLELDQVRHLGWQSGADR